MEREREREKEVILRLRFFREIMIILTRSVALLIYALLKDVERDSSFFVLAISSANQFETSADSDIYMYAHTNKIANRFFREIRCKVSRRRDY